MARPGKTIQMQVSIPKTLMKKLKFWAEKEKRSISNLVSLLLEKEIERFENKKHSKAQDR